MKRVAVFAYSRQGCRTARRVCACFPDAQCKAFTMERFEEEGFLPIEHPGTPFYKRWFQWADALIFIGSCGIAVRQIAPHLQDKSTDPAVVCIDELARYVIPLLSGHIGGANKLTLTLASVCNALPIITTATDIHRRFSVDAWAAGQGFVIDSLPLAKTISAAILERDIPFASDFPIPSPYPSGLVLGEKGPLGILLSYRQREPFQQTLRVIPPVLHLGLGCRKGTDSHTIQSAVEMVLNQHQLDHRAIKCAASIDLKAKEAGLLEYCQASGWPIHFYSAQELSTVPGEFTPSAFVQRITGVENVCERAALMDAGQLIVKKTAVGGVTVAVGVENLEVCFG